MILRKSTSVSTFSTRIGLIGDKLKMYKVLYVCLILVES